MKKLKRFSTVFLIAILALLLLTACGGGGGGSSSSGSNKPANSGSSTPANPEQSSSSGTTTPTVPKNWSESKTKKFFESKGIKQDNLYTTFSSTFEEYPVEMTYAVSGKRYSADGTAQDEDGTVQHIKELVDEKGDEYYVDYDEKTVTTYPAGSENGGYITDDIRILGYYIPVPNSANVGALTVGDYTYNGKTYYMESFKLRVTIDGTSYPGTWDYLYDENDNLKYVISDLMQTITEVKSISANPPESCFALPSWYQESTTGTSRTVQYFKSNGITDKRFYLEGTFSDNYTGSVYYTLNGEKGYMASVDSGATKPTYGTYVAGKEEAYVINYNDKTYRDESYNAQSYLESIQTAGEWLYNPAVSGYASMTIGTYQEGSKTYYKESYRPLKNYYTTYDFIFDGNKLVYIFKYGGTEKMKVVELSGTPRNDLLKLPDGYTEEVYN